LSQQIFGLLNQSGMIIREVGLSREANMELIVKPVTVIILFPGSQVAGYAFSISKPRC
jgi:hypothetical protein